ncbi:MAG: hypothetical protein V3T58_02945 [Candidatus Hydrothermarchaeales archaeon]
MKPLYVLAAEARLKGQPKRHAKVYKDDISVFEADMMHIRNHLLSNGTQSFGQIANATGVPKATVQKLLSPRGIRRVFDYRQLETMRKRNIKRYMKVLAGHTGVLRDGKGKWTGLEFRDSDKERFQAWLFLQGYMLLTSRVRRGEVSYHIVAVPPYLKEEINSLYTHRINP